MIREKQRDRVIPFRLVQRLKETDTGYKTKARWCVHGFKDPDIQTCRPWGTLADGENAFMQGEACQWYVRVVITNRLPVERGRLRDVDYCLCYPVFRACIVSCSWTLQA